MEIQEKMEIGIGTKEVEKLKPAMVNIIEGSIDPYIKDGKHKGDKVIFLCRHPTKEGPIKISAVKYLKNDKVTTSGLWLNLDEDGLITKGSVLALLLSKIESGSVKACAGKNIMTDLDANGYLCFKLY